MRHLVKCAENASSLTNLPEDSSTTVSGPGQRRVRLLLVETGAGGVEEQARRWKGEHLVVIGQSSEELPTTLAVRAIRRILSLEQAGHRIDLALVLLAPRFDLEATAARLLFARALMTHAASEEAPGCVLLLSGPQDLRPEIQELGDALVAEPSSWSLPIHLQFESCATETDADGLHRTSTVAGMAN